jgi:hypothetical protein
VLVACGGAIVSAGAWAFVADGVGVGGRVSGQPTAVPASSTAIGRPTMTMTVGACVPQSPLLRRGGWYCHSDSTGLYSTSPDEEQIPGWVEMRWLIVTSAGRDGVCDLVGVEPRVSRRWWW